MRFKETQVIVLANQKGGCAKTTSSISIAAAFNKLGYSVALVDTDPQCNATTSFGIDPHGLFDQGKLSLLDAYLDKRAAIDIKIEFEPGRFEQPFVLIPGNSELGEVGSHLELQAALLVSKFKRAEISLDDAKDEHRNRLRESLKSLRGVYDVVIIDTPPNLGFLMTTALVAADWFIIPAFPSKYDLAGLEELTITINKIKEKYNPTLKLAGVLLGNFDKNAKLDTQIYQKLCEKFGENAVFQTTISRGVRMRELTFSNKTIFEFDPDSPQADQFLSLVREMINRASKGTNTLKPLPELEKVIEHSEASQVDLEKFDPDYIQARNIENPAFSQDQVSDVSPVDYKEVGNG